jgi:hypothetical protein
MARPMASRGSNVLSWYRMELLLRVAISAQSTEWSLRLSWRLHSWARCERYDGLCPSTASPRFLAERNRNTASGQIVTLMLYCSDHRIGQRKPLKAISRVCLSRTAFTSFVPRAKLARQVVAGRVGGEAEYVWLFGGAEQGEFQAHPCCIASPRSSRTFIATAHDPVLARMPATPELGIAQGQASPLAADHRLIEGLPVHRRGYPGRQARIPRRGAVWGNPYLPRAAGLNAPGGM